MRNANRILKAVIVIGIAFAFIMPGAVAFTNMKTPVVKIDSNKRNPLISDPGWIEQTSGLPGTSRGVNYVHAVDENIVWAVGYDGSGGSSPVQEFTKTLNGGDLWEADVIGSAPLDGDSAMIFALDDMTAWVPIHSGNPQGIWKTSDGGDTWVRQETAEYSGTGAFPNVVHFWDENVGWCQGDPVDGYFEMYTTTDGGESWVRVPQENIPEPLPNEWGTVGYYDVVGDTVWWGTQCVTSPGRVLKSTDRGLNWAVYETPFPSAGWVDVRMKDADNGLAMDKRAAASYLAETSDGGETWIEVTPTGAFYGYDISYVPGTDNTWISTGAAAGASGASYSLDGGHTWVDYPEVNGIQLLDNDFIEGGIGWAGAFNVDEFTGGMYKYEPGAEEPDLEFEFEGGTGLTVTIKNVGFGDATNVEWSISIAGGLIIIPREDSGTIATIASGGSEDVTMSVFGIGLGIITDEPAFTVTAECDEGDSEEQTKTAKVFLNRVIL